MLIEDNEEVTGTEASMAAMFEVITVQGVPVMDNSMGGGEEGTAELIRVEAVEDEMLPLLLPLLLLLLDRAELDIAVDCVMDVLLRLRGGDVGGECEGD